MIISKYDEILNRLIEYNNNNSEINFGNVIVPFSTEKPTYPYTVVDEISNIPYNRYELGKDELSSVMYKVDIYAKTIGDKTKQNICRIIADQIDEFLRRTIGLKRTSVNVIPLENDASIYHIAMVYSGTIHNYRNKFI